MNNQTVQNRPTAAYYVSLIGGILGVLVSFFYIIVYGLFAAVTYDAYYYVESVEALIMVPIAIGIWILIASIIVIYAARKLNANPLEHTKWGAVILVFGIIGLGSILALIGGILALIYKPIPSGAAPQYQQYGYAPQPQPQQSYVQTQPYYPPQPTAAPAPQRTQQAQQIITRICPQCGRVIDETVKFCPHCGKSLG
jgi:hypothetical protein